MTTAGTPYQNLLSPRSRRLRTVGMVLLVAVLGMVAYGAAVIMPNVRREVETQKARNVALNTPVTPPTAKAKPGKAGAGEADAARQARQMARAKKVVFAKVAAAYAYWGVCMLLLGAVLLVAWLDWREVTRLGLTEQMALRAETIHKLQQTRDNGGPGAA